jgi:hypothetical protein
VWSNPTRGNSPQLECHMRGHSVVPVTSLYLLELTAYGTVQLYERCDLGVEILYCTLCLCCDDLINACECSRTTSIDNPIRPSSVLEFPTLSDGNSHAAKDAVDQILT